MTAPGSTFARRANSIGFLRLVLASLVVFSHAFVLGGFGPDPFERLSHSAWNMGALGVGGFFFLSGYLITKSYERCDDVVRFLWHRFLRIFPGFWVCLAITAFGFAALVYQHENGSLNRFLNGPDSPLQYLFRNWSLKMNQWGIDQLLWQNADRGFDGSLWTLNNEFHCYLAVALLGVIGVFKRARFLVPFLFVVLYIISLSGDVFNFVAQHMPFVGSIFQGDARLEEQATYFALGMVLAIYGERLPQNLAVFIACAAGIVIILPFSGFRIAMPFMVGYVLYWLAFKFPARDIDRRVDASYGMYIYAFPVQQLLVVYGVNGLGYWVYVSATLLLTASLALLSWAIVERPTLRLKNAAMINVGAAALAKLAAASRHVSTGPSPGSAKQITPLSPHEAGEASN